jgi:hypothetical protein
VVDGADDEAAEEVAAVAAMACDRSVKYAAVAMRAVSTMDEAAGCHHMGDSECDSGTVDDGGGDDDAVGAEDAMGEKEAVGDDRAECSDLAALFGFECADSEVGVLNTTAVATVAADAEVSPDRTSEGPPLPLPLPLPLPPAPNAHTA